MLKQHVTNRIFQLKQTRECNQLYHPALVTAITGVEAPLAEPKSKKKTDGGKDETPTTPAAKKANPSEPLTGAKPKPKPKTSRTRQPPKQKRKGADGNAIKSEEEGSDSGMWSEEEE
jgi:hypothetical protein